METPSPTETATGSGHIEDKLPVEDVFDLHPRRPGSVKLSPRSVAIVLGVLAVAVTFVVLIGLSLGSSERRGAGSSDVSSKRMSDEAIDRQNPVSDWAETYAFLQHAEPLAEEVFAAELQVTGASRPELNVPVSDLRQDELLDEMLSQMRAGFDSPVVFQVATRRNPEAVALMSPTPALAIPGGEYMSANLPLSAVGGARAGDLIFLRNPGRQPDRVSGTLKVPASPFELRAGSVIPAALITAIHSDLPGDLVAQAIQNVYDAETGKHLLVPQGSRLIGTYRNEVAAGQNRVLVVWQRLILPNGKSIGLDAMPGVDLTGAAGLHDQVDYHLKQVVGATALSSVIALTGNLARGGGDRDEPLSVVGETVAQQSARFGQQVIDRQLNRPPTITVRAGHQFNVLVNRDIPLEAFENVRSHR